MEPGALVGRAALIADEEAAVAQLDAAVEQRLVLRARDVEAGQPRMLFPAA